MVMKIDLDRILTISYGTSEDTNMTSASTLFGITDPSEILGLKSERYLLLGAIDFLMESSTLPVFIKASKTLLITCRP